MKLLTALLLWADKGAELNGETMLTEIASTLWSGLTEYLDATE